MQLIAKLVQVLPPVTGMGKNGEWKKQNLIFETDGQYPKKVCIVIWGDKINEAVLQVGSMLDVSFDAESREYNGNWFTDLRAWKIDPVGSAAGTPPTYNASNPSTATPPPVDFNSESGDDLPF